MTNEEKEKISKQVDIGARLLGSDDDVGPINFDGKKFGLCCDCKHLKAAITKYNKSYVQCYEFEIFLNSIDPVETCNRYERRGSMTLWEMKDIATIIEPFKKQAGFITGD